MATRHPWPIPAISNLHSHYILLNSHPLGCGVMLAIPNSQMN